MTLQGLRVLIAEDETLIRLDLRQMLEEHGSRRRVAGLILHNVK